MSHIYPSKVSWYRTSRYPQPVGCGNQYFCFWLGVPGMVRPHSEEMGECVEQTAEEAARVAKHFGLHIGPHHYELDLSKIYNEHD